MYMIYYNSLFVYIYIQYIYTYTHQVLRSTKSLELVVIVVGGPQICCGQLKESRDMFR